MKGRLPDSKAVRRKGKDGPLAEATDRQMVEKPPLVASVQALSDTWDVMVGEGVAYKPEDVPMLQQMCIDLEAARQAALKVIGEDGTFRLKVGKGEPDPETGEYLDCADNPYLKTMWAASDHALKLAEQMGKTPLARARLGLTQAAGKAVTLSIAEQIEAAMKRPR